MEFPDDVTTNIFTVENISKIRWSKWSRIQANAVSSPKISPSYQLDASAITYELRENNAHALHEVDSQEIWLFGFSNSSDNDFDEILASHQFTELSRGFLEATDPKIFGPTTTIVQSATSASLAEPLSNGTALESIDLYKKAMIAICAGLCHLFTSGKSEKWMPLGVSTCIDLSTLGLNSARPCPHDHVTNMIKFESRWDVTGRLTIAPTFSQVERLCQISIVTSQDLQVGTPLLLSPLGISTKYRGKLQEPSSDLIQSSKSQCSRLLSSQGLLVSPDSEWILVELNRDGTDNEKVVMIWPATYVLLNCGKMKRRSQDFGLDTSEDIDPLARAETWHLGRTARAAKAEIIRSEIELQVQQQLSQRTVPDRDVSSEIASPAFRDVIAPQDLSGIYPTPPDGLLSQTPASNVQQEVSPKFATTGQTDDQSGYSDGANENLFEDMDMDLVGEADFNFFDEPETEDMNGETYFSEEKSEDVGADSLSNRPANFEVAKNLQSNTETLNVDSDLGHDREDPLWASSSLENDNETSSLRLSLGKQDLEESRLQIREDLLSEVKNRGSFNPLKLANLDFDGKYGIQGRFGYIPVEGHKLKSNGPGKHEIFQIGMQLDRTESFDSDSEEALTDAEPNLPLGYEMNEDLNDLDETLKKIASGNVATPESPMDADLQENLRSVSSEARFPRVDHDGMDNFFRSRNSSKTARTYVEHNLFMKVAQLVADQVSWANYFPSPSSKSTPKLPKHLESVIFKLFPSAKHCHLKELVSSDSTQITKLKDASMGIQRVGTMTDVSSSAIKFWEELSFGPRSGPKNLNAFCIFPMKDYLVSPVKTFLEMMKGAYQVCNLGRHILDDSELPYPHGLVPIPNDGVAFDRDATAKFIKHISSLRLTGGNTVIYMLNIWDEGAIPEMCRFFLVLFYAYQKALDQEDLRNPNDLVLQLVPASMIFSTHELIVPSPAEYKRLAFQVYDRCGPPGNHGQTPFVCAPAICLAKPTPNAINFKLTVDSMETGEILNLAYKWEAGRQWLTACWTDNSGTISWNASYWLSKDEDVQTSFPQAATAMLETTRDIMESQRVFFQLYIVKDSPYEEFELEWWNLQTNSELSITILEIDPDPSITLFPPESVNLFPTLTDSLASPDPTPYAGTEGLSPDMSARVSTPGGTVTTSVLENDPEARLIDITEDTWSAITESSVCAVTTSSRHSLPLSTGFLVKRAGTQNEDGLLPLQINIIREPKSQHGRMEELFVMYRNLALLARVRNVGDPVKGIIPIHVATASKAHTALSTTMFYGG